MTTLPRRLGADGSPASESVPCGVEELSDLLHRATRGRKLLLVLDDAVSEAQVRPVLSSVPDSTVVLTSRQALGALEGVQHLVLDVLSRQDAAQLLLAAGGARMGQEPDAVAEIARLCGCLPLALRVAAAGLAARPHWKASELADRLRNERTRLAALALGDLDVRSSLPRPTGTSGRRSNTPSGCWRWRRCRTSHVERRRAARHLHGRGRAARRGAGTGEPAGGPPSPGSRTPVRYGFHSLLRSLALEMLASEAEPDAVREATERLGRACLTLARHADARLSPAGTVSRRPGTRLRPLPGTRLRLPRALLGWLLDRLQ